MKRTLIPMLATLIVVFIVFTGATGALAGGKDIGPQAPGGTPGPPGQIFASTGTIEPVPDHMPGPPPGGSQGPQTTPGAQATAQAGPHGKPTIYRGTLNALDDASLSITLADGSMVTLAITAETRIRVPGPKAQGDALLIGMHVVAQARTDANDDLYARSVMAIPGQPTLAHRVGTVTAYAPGASISILAVDGQTYTFALSADTKLLPAGLADTLAVDSRVTVIAPRDVSVLGWTATGIVVHPPLP